MCGNMARARTALVVLSNKCSSCLVNLLVLLNSAAHDTVLLHDCSADGLSNLTSGRLWRQLQVVRQVSTERSSPLYMFGPRSSRSGTSKPAFVRWLVGQRHYGHAWHVEEDVLLKGGDWKSFFSETDKQFGDTTHLVSARANTTRSWGWGGRRCQLRPGVPCHHKLASSDEQCDGCQTLWPLLRMSRRLAAAILDATTRGAFGHHEALTGAVCAREHWCTAKPLQRARFALGGSGGTHNCCSEASLCERLGVPSLARGWVYHPVKCDIGVQVRPSGTISTYLRPSGRTKPCDPPPGCSDRKGGPDAVGSCPVRWEAGRAPLVVTLTTVPSRLQHLAVTIDSLHRQSLPPDEVVLNIPRKWRSSNVTLRASDLAAAAPGLEALQAAGKVSVHWIDDLGPITKLVPTIKRAAAHARRFVDRRCSAAAGDCAAPENLAAAEAGMGVLVVDDDQAYASSAICDLVLHAKGDPDAALGFRGFTLFPEKVLASPGRSVRALACEAFGAMAYRLPFGRCVLGRRDNESLRWPQRVQYAL